MALRLAEDFGVLEMVIVKTTGRVEDLDAGEAAVFPVEGDESVGAGRVGCLEGGAARRERVTGELDLDRFRCRVVGDPHSLIVPLASARSW